MWRAPGTSLPDQRAPAGAAGLRSDLNRNSSPSARRRAPSGCGPQARWLCCSLLTYGLGIARRALPAGTAVRSPGGLQQNVKLFLREPLALCELEAREPTSCAKPIKKNSSAFVHRGAFMILRLATVWRSTKTRRRKESLGLWLRLCCASPYGSAGTAG